MTPAKLAKVLAEFRLQFGLVKDLNYKQAVKYYQVMIKAKQLELILSEPDKNKKCIVLACCEIWFVDYETLKIIEDQIKNKIPVNVKDVSLGEVAFFSNLILDPSITFQDIIGYLKFKIKNTYRLCNQWCWFNHKENKMSKIYEVQRCHQQ